MNVQITNYTKSEKVEITYNGHSSYFIYDNDCPKLTKQLLLIMSKGWKVEIITKEYI